MKTKSTANHQIEALKKDYECKKLKANLEYQRYNNAWGRKNKISLIISILQNYPIGEIIRNKVTSSDGISDEFEIVDGYQRLTTLSEFMSDKFAIDTENSKKIIETYLAHFKILNDESSRKILKNFDSDNNIRLKFKNLPKTLQDKISTTEVSVATLSNWDREDVIEYFRRVQEGKPLTNADKLHTIQTELTTKLKKISSDESILNCLGLNLVNGGKRRGSDRIIYQTSLEAIYCKLGQSIGQPSKLDSFFKELDSNDNLDSYLSIIENFLNSLSTSDRVVINQKSITTDLKIIFCLLLFGQDTFKNLSVKDYKYYIINLTIIGGLLKNYNHKRTTENRVELLKKLDDSGLTDIYENNSEIFDEFSKLRSGAHSHRSVEVICSSISKLFENINRRVLETV